MENPYSRNTCELCDGARPQEYGSSNGEPAHETDSDLALALEIQRQEEDKYRMYKRQLNAHNPGNVRVALSPHASPLSQPQAAKKPPRRYSIYDDEYEEEEEDEEETDRYGVKDSHELKKRILYDHQAERGEHNVTTHDREVAEQLNAVRLTRFDGAGDMGDGGEVRVPDTIYNNLKQHFHSDIKLNRKASMRQSRRTPGKKPSSTTSTPIASPNAAASTPVPAAVATATVAAEEAWPTLGSAASSVVIVPHALKKEGVWGSLPTGEADNPSVPDTAANSADSVGTSDASPAEDDGSSDGVDVAPPSPPLAASIVVQSAGVHAEGISPSTPTRSKVAAGSCGKSGKKSSRRRARSSSMSPATTGSTPPVHMTEPIQIPSSSGVEEPGADGAVMVTTPLGGGLLCGSLESRLSSEEGWEEVPFFDLDAAGHAVPASSPTTPTPHGKDPANGVEGGSVPASPDDHVVLTRQPRDLPLPTAELEEVREQAVRLRQQVTMLQHFGKGQVRRNEELLDQIAVLKAALAKAGLPNSVSELRQAAA